MYAFLLPEGSAMYRFIKGVEALGQATGLHNAHETIWLHCSNCSSDAILALSTVVFACIKRGDEVFHKPIANL